MDSEQVQPLQVRVDLGVMENEWVTLHSPKQESHYRV